MKRIASIPVLGISLIAALLAFVILGILSGFIDKPLTYVVWVLMNASASFLICILHPKQVWIVPLLCNSFVAFPAILDDSFWSTSFGLIIGLGVVFSILMAHFGALLGRRRESRKTIKTD
ncbi:MAG: hypothetical protein KJ970_19855 [Candidatus Eisenbacteria bacterium]|uniref:Uncharacterized protein n=1 Tax=Eiseniibacteriota bacterium TaxID=2212470 RepID=A0A948S1J1_UNCEI|nr:hypothetical protein [Candidatus Eisenbacteria bacterium]MBU1950317.1 hypothetical protein [Candidatus Eisenbacteria bacterium]MBU2693177.1 hypothetical protein [Candidatus Eisenbacteria bacterium]